MLHSLVVHIAVFISHQISHLLLEATIVGPEFISCLFILVLCVFYLHHLSSVLLQPLSKLFTGCCHWLNWLSCWRWMRKGRGSVSALSKFLLSPAPASHVERKGPMGIWVRNTRLLAYDLLNSNLGSIVCWWSATFSLWTHCTWALIGAHLSLGNDCLTLDKSGSTFCGGVCIHDGMWRSFTILPFFVLFFHGFRGCKGILPCWLVEATGDIPGFYCSPSLSTLWWPHPSSSALVPPLRLSSWGGLVGMDGRAIYK